VNFLKKLLLFTLISISQAYGMDLENPKLCDGFVSALAEDFQQEYRNSNKNWPTCSNAACYKYKEHKLCRICLLNAYATDIFTPLIDDEILKVNSDDMMTLSTDINIYNPQAVDLTGNKAIETLASIRTKVDECCSDRNIQPLVDHHGVPGCPGFESMTTSEEKSEIKKSVCSEVVPDNCVHCYEALVKKNTGDKIPYMVILPSTKAVKSGMGSVTGTLFDASNMYRLGLKDEKTTAEHFRTMPSGRTVKCLVICGDHGISGTLFGKGETFWKEQVVKPLISTGFKAEKIILEACHTASMIDCFKDLLTPDGQIIAGISSTHNALIAGGIKNLAVDDKGCQRAGIKDSHEISIAIKKSLKFATNFITTGELPIALINSALAFREMCIQTKLISEAEANLGASLIEWSIIFEILTAWKNTDVVKVNKLIDKIIDLQYFAASDNATIKAQLKQFKSLEEKDAMLQQDCMEKVEKELVANITKMFNANTFEHPGYTGLFASCKEKIIRMKEMIAANQLSHKLDDAEKELYRMLIGERIGILHNLREKYRILHPCEYCIYCKRDDTIYFDALWESPAAKALQGSHDGKLFSLLNEQMGTLKYIQDKGIRTIAAHNFCRFQEVD